MSGAIFTLLSRASLPFKDTQFRPQEQLPIHGALALDSMPKACHIHAMANLQVKNIPDTLHQRLRRYAQEHNCTLSDVVLIALERELARREWHERLAQRPTTDLGVSAASLLAQERQQRERDLT
jgi:plasmid stability protein